MVGTANLHHPAPFPRENAEEFLTMHDWVLVGADSDHLVDEGEVDPRMGGTLWAKHGVGAENVKIGGERMKKEVFGELFDGKHLDKECAAF